MFGTFNFYNIDFGEVCFNRNSKSKRSGEKENNVSWVHWVFTRISSSPMMCITLSFLPLMTEKIDIVKSKVKN